MQRVRLHQQSLELHPIEELAQGLDLTAGISGVGALGDGHTQAVGVEAHLGDKTRSAGSGFIDRAPQGFAITDQGVNGLCYAGLGRHPLLQQALKALHIQLGQQQPKRGVRWRLGDIGAKQLVEGLAVPLGKTLHAHQRALVAENGEDRHQQHPPLRIADPPTHAAIGQRLEEADQIGCSRRVLEWRGQRDERRFPRKAAQMAAAVESDWDRLLMGPGS
jgi:hypothetical protein